MKDVLIWAGMWVIGFVLIYCIRPKRKNKRVGLPAPSHLCKRNSTESVP